MTQYSMKNRQLSWFYVNHERREYLAGNFLVTKSDAPASPPTITESLRPDSAVGAALLLLITPYACKADGKTVAHDLRGIWAGHHIVTVNNKLDRETYVKVEQEYTPMELPCMDFLRENNAGWDKALYECAKDFWVLEPPRKKKITG